MYISVAVMVALFIWKLWGFPPIVSGLYNITLADTVISGYNLVFTILSPLHTSVATMVAIFISQQNNETVHFITFDQIMI